MDGIRTTARLDRSDGIIGKQFAVVLQTAAHVEPVAELIVNECMDKRGCVAGGFLLHLGYCNAGCDVG